MGRETEVTNHDQYSAYRVISGKRTAATFSCRRIVILSSTIICTMIIIYGKRLFEQRKILGIQVKVTNTSLFSANREE